jgi:hypothetical protein
MKGEPYLSELALSWLCNGYVLQSDLLAEAVLYAQAIHLRLANQAGAEAAG